MKQIKSKSLLPIASVLLATMLCQSVHAGHPTKRHYLKKGRHRKTQTETTQKKQRQLNLPPTCEVTPSAGPHTGEGWGYSISADYIYWKYHYMLPSSQTRGVTSGRAGVNRPTMNTGAEKGVTWQPLNDFGSGFKVALGLFTPYDGVDVKAEYIWNRFHVDSTFNVNHLDGSNNLNAIQSFAQLNNRATDTFRYNKINLEVGRDCKLSPRLNFRPHLGLTGAWFKAKWDQYQNAGPIAATPDGSTTGNLRGFAFPGSTHFRGKETIWGVGLRTGLNYFWEIVDNFGIYSNVTANALLMESDRDIKNSVYNNTTGANTVFAKTHTNGNMVGWVTEFEAGLRYGTDFNHHKNHVMCQIGWEAQNWFNTAEDTDLSFQGLDVKLRFSF